MNHACGNGTLRWLSLGDAEDRALYSALWEASKVKRPQDSLGYLLLVQPQNHDAAAVYFSDAGAGTVLYPFFFCELNQIPGFSQIGNNLRHLVSPYGYGGPLFEGDPSRKAEVSRAFEQAFHAELRDRGFVSEFVREDLFSSHLADREAGELVEQQPNVVVRLDRDPDEIWAHYKNTVRSNIKQAQRSGLRVSFDTEGRSVDWFLHVYYETMRRRNAAEFFFIPKSRFEYLASTLGRAGLTYVHVHDGDHVVASELVLICGDTLYAFLSASLASAFAKRPNDLMRHEIILWGRENGYKYYVLGGGISASDGIYRFKRAFDPGSTMPFRTRKVVHDADAYHRLVAAKRTREMEQGRHDWTPKPGYFPEFLA